MVRTALRSVTLSLVFITAVCLYAFARIFRRLEALEAERHGHTGLDERIRRADPVRTSSPRALP